MSDYETMRVLQVGEDNSFLTSKDELEGVGDNLELHKENTIENTLSTIEETESNVFLRAIAYQEVTH